LPEELRTLAENPPSKEEAKYLSRDTQIMIGELSLLNKGMENMPKIREQVDKFKAQRDDWTLKAVRQGETDKGKVLDGVAYPHGLETQEKIARSISSEMDRITTGAEAYTKNNSDIIKKDVDRLSTLRRELQAPMPYSEAKSGIPLHKKPVVNWLDDLRDKGSLEDRLLAKQVLDKGGIDAKAILTEADRQGLSTVDRAVAEAQERQEGKEAKGTTMTEKAP
jgi:hypothetical protein